jgi:hypothetical protein
MTAHKPVMISGAVEGLVDEVVLRRPVDLAARSRRRAIREDMVPRSGSGRSVGQAYASRLIEFVDGYWRPEMAANNSDSLRRCCERLDEIVARMR